MFTAPVAEQLVAAHSDVKRACDLLIAPTPEALDDCHEVLQRATRAIQQWQSQSETPSADQAVRASALALRSEVRRATRLLEGIATFYLGWERILGALSGGYTASGDPARVERSGNFCCRG